MKAQLFSSNFPIHHHHKTSQPPPNLPTFFRPSSSIPRFPPQASSGIPLPQQLLDAALQEVSAEEVRDGWLLVRRPAMESGDGDDDEEEDRVGRTAINQRLLETAKRMPVFKPERGEGSGAKKEEKLAVNLDLALYKAKVLGRKYEFGVAQKILEKVYFPWNLGTRSIRMRCNVRTCE